VVGSPVPWHTSTVDGITSHVGPDGITLAELFALRNGDPTAAVPTAHPVGQYL
jgi:hypothetical protein